MDKSKYNIIWADDEVRRFTEDSQYKKMFNRYNITILKACSNGKSFESAIEELMNQHCRIDAVITDANFPYADFDSDKERDIDGLRTVTQFMEKYRHIPVYLYTGRKDIKELARERDLKNFDTIYYKDFSESNNFKTLLERLTEDADYRGTTEFRVDNSFIKELEYARNLDKFIRDAQAEKFIRTNLIRSFDNHWDFAKERPQEMLTTARKLFEAMASVGREWGIFPPIEELNTISIFLQGKHKEYIQIEEIMPASLARALWYFLDITQDGSHLKGDLKLGVDAYVTRVQNANLLRSILHISIDLIIWFVDYALRCMTPSGFTCLWEKIETENNKTNAI